MDMTVEVTSTMASTAGALGDGQTTVGRIAGLHPTGGGMTGYTGIMNLSTGGYINRHQAGSAAGSGVMTGCTSSQTLGPADMANTLTEAGMDGGPGRGVRMAVSTGTTKADPVGLGQAAGAHGAVAIMTGRTTIGEMDIASGSHIRRGRAQLTAKGADHCGSGMTAITGSINPNHRSIVTNRCGGMNGLPNRTVAITTLGGVKFTSSQTDGVAVGGQVMTGITTS